MALPDAAQIKECALRDASNLTTEQIVKWQGLLDLMKKSDYVDNSGKIKAEKLPDNLATLDDIPDLSNTVQVDDDQNFTDAEKAKARANIGAISAADITLEDGSVTTPKLADGAVKTDKIADENVTTSKIEDGAIMTNKITNKQVTKAKCADDVFEKIVQVDSEQDFTDVEEIQGRENVGIYNSDVSLDSLARKADTEQILYKDFDASNRNIEKIIIPKVTNAVIKLLCIFTNCKIRTTDTYADAYINYKTQAGHPLSVCLIRCKNSSQNVITSSIIGEMSSNENIYESEVTIEPKKVFAVLKGRIYYTLYYFPDSLK